MDTLGTKVQVNQEKMMNASTDMGSAHNPAFAACAGTDEGHKSALNCASGMAMLALRVLLDDDVARKAKEDFDQDDE
jgi:hypothetical protein